MTSGVPNRRGLPSLSLYSGKLRIAIWNARALFHQSMIERRAAKLSIVKRALPNLDVLFLQETHGSREDIIAEFHEFEQWFDFRFSAGSNPATGGLLIFVRKVLKDQPLHTNIEDFVIIPGRALETTIFFGERKELVLVNVHNSYLTAQQTQQLVSRLEHQRIRAHRAPFDVELFVGGDFNLMSHGDTRCFLKGPAFAATQPVPVPNGGRLAIFLEKLTEFSFDGNTHFDHMRCSESLIDRWFGSIPSSVLRQVKSEVTLSHNPHDLW